MNELYCQQAPLSYALGRSLEALDLSFNKSANQIGSIEFEMKISSHGSTPDGVSFSIADASSNNPETEIYGDSSSTIYQNPSLYFSQTGVWS